jgi:hypothetical protein
VEIDGGQPECPNPSGTRTVPHSAADRPSQNLLQERVVRDQKRRLQRREDGDADGVPGSRRHLTHRDGPVFHVAQDLRLAVSGLLTRRTNGDQQMPLREALDAVRESCNRCGRAADVRDRHRQDRRPVVLRLSCTGDDRNQRC